MTNLILLLDNKLTVYTNTVDLLLNETVHSKCYLDFSYQVCILVFVQAFKFCTQFVRLFHYRTSPMINSTRRLCDTFTRENIAFNIQFRLLSTGNCEQVMTCVLYFNSVGGSIQAGRTSRRYSRWKLTRDDFDDEDFGEAVVVWKYDVNDEVTGPRMT